MMNQKIHKDAFWTFIVRIPVILFSFLHAIFLIRLLGTEGNGLYAYITAGITFTMLLTGFDFKNSAVYHLAKPGYDNAKIIGIYVKVYVVGTVIVAGIAVFMFSIDSPLIHFIIPAEYINWLYIGFFILSFICQRFILLFSRIMSGLKSFTNFNKYTFYASLIQLLVFLYLMATTMWRDEKYSIPLIFSIILLVQGISLTMAYLFYNKSYTGRVDFSTKEVQTTTLNYAKLGYINQIGHFLNKRVDVWFVEVFAGLASLGLYALATQMTNFILLILTPFEDVLRPYLTEMGRAEGNRIFVVYFRVLVLAIIVIAGILILIAPLLIRILFGNEFLSAITPLQILSVAIIFVAIKRLIIGYNRSFKDLRINNWAQWTGVILTIVLDVILIPDHGIIGAAYASLIAYFSTALILISYLIYKTNMTLTDLFLFKPSDLIAVLRKQT